MKRSFQFVFLLLALTAAASAQVKMTLEQLVDFVKYSVRSHEDDRKVAETVKKIHLSNQLDAHTVETLQTLGAGRLTVAALRTLVTDSASLPAAPAPVQTPKPVLAPMAALDAVQQKE